MKVAVVDPRDVNSEFDVPLYRVYFWTKPTLSRSAEGGEPQTGRLYTSHSYELTGCHNVREAFAWADENTGADRTYTLFAAVRFGENLALIRLYGVDPTKHKGDQELEWPGEVYE